jgi:hypothetical protein
MTKKARRSPQAKKRLSLTRDRIIDAKWPKAFRKNWPKKKARAERSYRRTVKQGLKSPDLDETEERLLNSRRKPVKKWPGSALTLAAMIAERRRRRTKRYRRKIKSKAALARLKSKAR